MKGVVALDVGTTSLRAIVFDEQGRALHVEQRANAPGYFGDGRVEQDPLTWHRHALDALRAGAAAAARAGVEPACVSLTAQRSSVVPVDDAGAPLHPAIMWQDTRSAGIARELADCDATVYRRTGLRISPVFSAVKMAWLRRNRPDVWRATRKLLGVQDWIVHLLTGSFVTDQSLGSRTNLMSLETREWDPDMLRLFEVPREMLCDLVPPGAVAGGLAAGAARLTGLPQGLPVVSAGGDQQCAALGLGLLSAEIAISNTGTGSYLIGHAARPVLDERMRVSCNVSAAPGAYIVEAAMLTTGAVHQWFRELVAGADGVPPSPAELDHEASAVPQGANGLVVLPHFEGSGSPHWDPGARGAIVNLSLETSRGAIARAILEAIAIELKGGLDVVEELCGPVGRVHASGGLTKSALFNRIQADVLERPLLRFEGGEATAHGAWIAGCVATGLAADHAEAFGRLSRLEPPRLYDPDASTREAYRGQRARSLAAYDALAAVAAGRQE